MTKVEIFTDGSARGNPDGPGGYGTILQFTDSKGVLHERELSGGFVRTTNNRMELLAAAALRAGLPGKRAAALLDCNTTEDALQSLSAEERGKVTASLLEKIHAYLKIRAGSSAGPRMRTGAILFSNVYGLLGMTRGAKEILDTWNTAKN